MKNQGFSLTELSVVIVIIALLVSAMMKGQSIVAEAKLQAIVAEVSQNKISITSFYNKYGKYPGDFNEAVDNWGAGTVDGNNNGQIEFVNSSGSPVYEGYRAWQHLADAGMVTSPYIGTATTGTVVPGSDIPASKAGGGYLLDYGQYGITNKNIMVLGVPVASSSSPVLANGTLTPSQAMGIDQKIDDANPLTGSVRGVEGNSSTAKKCVDTVYQISLAGKDCIMIFQAND